MIRTCLSGLAALLAPATALAQDREPFADAPQGPLLRGDVAGSRQPQVAGPAGIEAGPLRLLPAVKLRTAADSKVTSGANGNKGDVFVVLEPELQVRHEGATTRAVLRANAALARYSRLSEQNRDAFGASGELRWRAGARTTVSANASIARAYEENFTAETAEGAASPARFDERRAAAGLEAELAAARVNLSATLVRRDYAPVRLANGARRDQSFRDSETKTLAASGELSLRPGFFLLAQARHGWIESLNPDPCCDRSGSVTRLMAGLRGEITPLVSFELLGGHLRRGFDTASFRDYSGPVWRARLEWYATPLITVAATTSRDLVSGGLRDAAGVEVDSTELRVYYELRRDLGVEAHLNLGHERYRGTGITARSKAAGLLANYTINEQLRSGGFFRWHSRTSSSPRLDATGPAVEGGLWIRFAI